MASFDTKSKLLGLDWISKNERYFMALSATGSIRLLDTHLSRTLWELNGENNSNLKGSRYIISVDSPLFFWPFYHMLLTISLYVYL